jgi:O-antigen ligase
LAPTLAIVFLFLVAGAFAAFKDPYYGLLFLIFALPFERFPSFDVGGVTIRPNQAVAVLLLLSLLAKFLFDRWKFRPNPLLIPIILFVGEGLWGVLWAGDTGRAVQVGVFLAFMALTSLGVTQAIRKKEQLPLLGWVLLGLSVLLVGFALFQFLGDMVGLPSSLTLIREGYGKNVFGFPRVHDFSQEPLYFANFLFLPLGVLAGMFFAKVKSIPRSWLFLVLGATLITFLLTLSRGAFIGAAGFLLVFLVFFVREIVTPRNLISAAAAIVIAAGAVWAILGYVGPDARERFISHATLQDVRAGQGESGVGRISTYDRAIAAWQENPIFGIGLGNYGPWVKNYPPEAPDSGWDIVNNQYLETLAEQGIVGLSLLLLIYMMTLFRSVKAILRSQDPLVRGVLIGLTAAFVGVLIQYNFFSTIYIMHIWVTIGLLVAVQNLVLEENKVG